MKYLSEESLKTLISNMKVVSSNTNSVAFEDSIKYFNTFEDLKKYKYFQNETIVATLGYETIGDGGATKYMVKRVNLFDISESKSGIYLNKDGVETVYGSSLLTGYIRVQPNTKYTYSGIDDNSGIYYSAFYDSNKNIISLWNQETGVNTITTPPNCYYIRMTAPGNLYFVKGDTIGDITVTSDVEIIKDEFCLRMIVENDRINIVQLGFLPNVPTQDCHDAITRYIELCNRDDRKYELFFPNGCWAFSETDIHNGRKGVVLKGVSSQVGTDNRTGESTIMPFNEGQEYIWNFGKSRESTEIVAGNIVKNLTISTGQGRETNGFRKSFCKIGILLTYCCYSEFDGIYAHYFNGTPLAVQVGFENRFGYLNMRLCGYYDKETTYSPIWIKKHPVSNPASGFSANYFDYINFENINGSAIYFEPGTDIVHCEFNNIQCEWAINETGGWNPDFGVTYGDTINWDDESENIEHIYLIKGQSTNQYNPIMFNTISVSSCYINTIKFTYTDDNGETVTKYKRISGIFGPDEVYKNTNVGLNVCVSKLSAIGDTTRFPVYHAVDMKNIINTNVNIGILDGLYIFTQTKNLLKKQITRNNKPKNNMIHTDGHIYYTDDLLVRSGGYVDYDENSINEDKMFFTEADLVVPIDGSKKITLRLKINENAVSELEKGQYNISMYFTLKDGTTLSEYIGRITKNDVETGYYPVNEWFDYEVPFGNYPFDDIYIEFRVRRNSVLSLDAIKISSKDRTITASNLTSAGMLKSAIGAQAWCTDRRESTQDELGVMMVFNGTEWKSIKGTKLTDLLS